MFHSLKLTLQNEMDSKVVELNLDDSGTILLDMETSNIVMNSEFVNELIDGLFLMEEAKEKFHVTEAK